MGQLTSSMHRLVNAAQLDIRHYLSKLHHLLIQMNLQSPYFPTVITMQACLPLQIR